MPEIGMENVLKGTIFE
jgi:hypothetical protein